MAIPHDDHIQYALLELLAFQPGGKMQSMDVYQDLAQRFPQLTEGDLHDKYRNSVSHWANRVQFAVLHMRKQGWLLHDSVAGERGLWTITEKGRRWLAEAPKISENLLKELEQ